jgi:hypothetical protein
MNEPYCKCRNRYCVTAMVFCIPIVLLMTVRDYGVSPAHPSNVQRIVVALFWTTITALVIHRKGTLRTQFERLLTTSLFSVVVCGYTMIYDINLANIGFEPFAFIYVIMTWGILMFTMIYLASFTAVNFKVVDICSEEQVDGS